MFKYCSHELVKRKAECDAELAKKLKSVANKNEAPVAKKQKGRCEKEEVSSDEEEACGHYWLIN